MYLKIYFAIINVSRTGNTFGYEIYCSETYVNYITQRISKEKAFTDDHQWRLQVFVNKLILKEIKEHNNLLVFLLTKKGNNFEKPLKTLYGKHLRANAQKNRANRGHSSKPNLPSF